MLKDPNSGASYTQMFDQNDDIKQTKPWEKAGHKAITLTEKGEQIKFH